ncbi:MAG: O-antigen ligase family protein [Paludibacteraceae bacterium]|nr:O-antigen ligase family protein [Paludibacteraceae bacterium]
MLARGFLFTGALPLVHFALLAAKFALVPVAVILVLRTPGKPTAVDLGLLVYAVAMYVCCLINHTQILTITLMALDIFIFWALCRWFFVRRSLFPLKATTLILLVFIALNFVLLLWRPGGLWKYEVNGKMYFLLGGNYNNMGKALFFALVSNMLLLRLLPHDEYRQRWFYRVVLVTLVLLSAATLVIVGSTTSFVGISLILAFGVLMLLTAYHRSRLSTLRILSVVLFVAVYFALQSWAVFRDQDTDAPRTEYFVEHVLKKDLTFTLRTHVWNASKRLIERQPVVGYGEHDDQWYQLELEGLTTHNLVLHILLKGGWVCLSAFILLLLTTHLHLSSLARHSSPVARDVGFILLFALWTYLFMQIFETYSFYSMSILFIYVSCLGYVLPETSDN